MKSSKDTGNSVPKASEKIKSSTSTKQLSHSSKSKHSSESAQQQHQQQHQQHLHYHTSTITEDEPLFDEEDDFADDYQDNQLFDALESGTPSKNPARNRWRRFIAYRLRLFLLICMTLIIVTLTLKSVTEVNKWRRLKSVFALKSLTGLTGLSSDFVSSLQAGKETLREDDFMSAEKLSMDNVHKTTFIESKPISITQMLEKQALDLERKAALEKMQIQLDAQKIEEEKRSMERRKEKLMREINRVDQERVVRQNDLESLKRKHRAEKYGFSSSSGSTGPTMPILARDDTASNDQRNQAALTAALSSSSLDRDLMNPEQIAAIAADMAATAPQTASVKQGEPEPDSSKGNTTAGSIKSTALFAKAFRGLDMMPIEDYSVNRLTFMLHKFIAENKIRSVAVVTCFRLIAWMPAFMQRLDFDFPGIEFHCFNFNQTDGVAPEIERMRKQYPSFVNHHIYPSTQGIEYTGVELVIAWHWIQKEDPAWAVYELMLMAANNASYVALNSNRNLPHNRRSQRGAGTINVRTVPFNFREPLRTINDVGIEDQSLQLLIFELKNLRDDFGPMPQRRPKRKMMKNLEVAQFN